MDKYKMLKVSTSRFFYEIWATIKSGERFQKPKPHIKNRLQQAQTISAGGVGVPTSSAPEDSMPEDGCLKKYPPPKKQLPGRKFYVFVASFIRKV
jgi:hypothetical protein